jgi:hypothetical protein
MLDRQSIPVWQSLWIAGSFPMLASASLNYLSQPGSRLIGREFFPEQNMMSEKIQLKIPGDACETLDIWKSSALRLR